MHKTAVKEEKAKVIGKVVFSFPDHQILNVFINILKSMLNLSISLIKISPEYFMPDFYLSRISIATGPEQIWHFPKPQLKG